MSRSSEEKNHLRGHFSSETVKARKKRHNIFPLLKVNKDHPAILDPATTPFRNEGEIKTF